MDTVQIAHKKTKATSTLNSNLDWEGDDEGFDDLLNDITQEGLILFPNTLLGPDGDPWAKVAFYCQTMLGPSAVDVILQEDETEEKRVY